MQDIEFGNKRTLVIGGAGYIGSHLVPELVATGRIVTVLGKSLKPFNEMPAGINYVVGDFGCQALISNLLDCHDEVIHLAYATVPNTSYEDPLSDLLQNLPPTVQLFSEVAKRGLKLLFVSSGGTVYGEANQLPICEDHPTKPISPYGVTKLTLENYARLYAVTHGLKFICVRPSNAFGIGQKPLTGQGFISTAIALALSGHPVRIYGKCGTIRDYLYVSDLASGIIAALDHGRYNEIYNIGSGIGMSNVDVIREMLPFAQEKGIEIRMEHLPKRPFDVRSNVLDSSKLTIHTGWLPMVNFCEGLRTTFEYNACGFSDS